MWRFHRAHLAVGLMLLLAILIPTTYAWAEGQGSTTLAPVESDQAKLGDEVNPQAAMVLPHDDLSREEAADLVEGVFGEQLQATDPFSELDVQRYYSNNLALVDDSRTGDPALLESSLPLRAEDDAGQNKGLNFTLKRSGDGDLEPVNPLVDLELPVELGQGIALPQVDLQVEVTDRGSDRTPSILGGNAAFYPNIAEDTDLTVTPTTTGMEIFTQLRTAEAPTSTTYRIQMQQEDLLRAQGDGGAEINRDGKTIATIPPPTAIDAAGQSVAATLDVASDSMVVTVHPSEATVYPIFVDPLLETWNWNMGNTNGLTLWSPGWNSSLLTAWYENGLNLGSNPGSLAAGAYSQFVYRVPRWNTDFAKYGSAPTSFIAQFQVLGGLYWSLNDGNLWPVLRTGLRDESAAWVSMAQRSGMDGPMSGASVDHKNLNNNVGVKEAVFTVQGDGGTQSTASRRAQLNNYWITLDDSDSPSFGFAEGPTKWLNGVSPAGQGASNPVKYSVEDSGLGIYSVSVKVPSAQGGRTEKTISAQCGGGNSVPCPREMQGSMTEYDPVAMPQGEVGLSFTAKDPVEHSSPVRLAQVKVDRTLPQLSVSGNLTEQASVGTKLHEYTLNYNASDGDDAAAVGQTPLGVQGTGAGQLERPQGVAVDAAGNVWVSDKDNNRVLEYDSSGKVLRELPSGIADGQVSSPRGIAVAPNGNVWVAEAGNKRLQQFTPAGAFVSKVTNASFIEPWGIAFGPEGSLWVTDNAAAKIFKFSQGGVLELSESSSNVNSGVPYGIDVDAFGHPWIAFQGTDQIVETYIGQGKLRPLFTFGGTGTAAGQFRSPYDIAIAKSGNILVTDALNNRVQNFRPDGTFLRQYGTEGVASTQFKEPRAVAVGLGNTLVVADAGNHRVGRWIHADQDPQSGIAKLEVKVDGATVKSSAPGCATKNCAISGSWVLNANNFSSGPHKVDVVSTDSVGLTATKSLNIETRGDLVAPGVALSGSMTEQAIVGTTRTTYKLKVNATDTGSAAEWKSGVVATTIKVDGTPVDSYSAACSTEACGVTREWTMQSSEYLGSHKVQVTATDGAGRTTTKELSITIDKDVTPPKIITGGEAFFTQPQNWLVQKAYAYTTSATDENASGVASFQFKIDGAVIKQAYGTCAGGSCSKSLSGELNVLNYAGGAHPAELVATDIAGNVAKKTWTINVDPEGHISVGEATDTLEAVEATAPQATELAPVDALVTEAPGPDGLNPTLVPSQEQFEAEGTPTPSSIEKDPDAGFAIDSMALSAGGTTHEDLVEIVPNAVAANASMAESTDGSAAVVSNSSTSADTVLRPIYNGIMSFQAIRDSAAPIEYSWEVRLAPGESLKAIDSSHAGVFWEDGTEAMLISAQPAHQADGSPVPTTVSVSAGNVITLKVDHRKPGTIYPVVAGVGWQGGFQYDAATYEVPPAPAEESDLTYEAATEQLVGNPPVVYFADASDPEGATASGGHKYLQEFAARQCEYRVIGGPNCGVWELKLKGFFWFNYKKAWVTRIPSCPKSYLPGGVVTVNNPSRCAWIGGEVQKYGGGYHLTAQALYSVTYVKIGNREHHLSVYAYGSGYWNDHDTDCVCNPLD